MSEPTEAAYEAAIDLLSRKADITGGGPLGAAWVVPTDLLRELLAVVQPIAVAEGRRQAAAAIRNVGIIDQNLTRRERDIRRRDWFAGIAKGGDDA
jgi:hypothetical protein